METVFNILPTAMCVTLPALAARFAEKPNGSRPCSVKMCNTIFCATPSSVLLPHLCSTSLRRLSAHLGQEASPI